MEYGYIFISSQSVPNILLLPKTDILVAFFVCFSYHQENTIWMPKNMKAAIYIKEKI